jgi:hypothetical protein
MFSNTRWPPMSDRIPEEAAPPESASVLASKVDPTSARFEANMRLMA